MAVDAYPSTLPAPLKAGKERRQVAAFRLIEPYRGRSYVQPIGTDTPVFWNLTFRFTQAQALIFWVWFETVIDRGVKPFTMPIRTEFGVLTYELQFLPDGLLDTSEDGPNFTYKATVMARKMIIPDEYIDNSDDIIDGNDLNSIVVAENLIAF